MSEPVAFDEKRMRLRYAGVCRICGCAMAAKTDAVYERSTKTVRCVSHEAGTASGPVAEVAIDPGVPGASARREFERRKTSREQLIRQRRPKIGSLLLALSDEPQSTKAWDTGAIGEERLGQRLNELASDTLRVIHDRRIPGTRANIDHLAVTPSGVHVIDPKRYQGRRPQLKVEGGFLRPRTEKLVVGRRDCTKLVDGVLGQVEIVHSIVGTGVSVHGTLCFVDADWPLIGGAFTTRGIDILWPKKLYGKLEAEGRLSAAAITDLHRRLASSLPPA